ncbi:hypothetical protein DAMA08_012210 [Martiniozyma asiatica (nom. inval.)]|nr:hypothetical protein DAMA08_012210 [Martiniozyma asiatica]
MCLYVSRGVRFNFEFAQKLYKNHNITNSDILIGILFIINGLDDVLSKCKFEKYELNFDYLMKGEYNYCEFTIYPVEFHKI